jgi:Carboxypeptidase regulatory-like domain
VVGCVLAILVGMAGLLPQSAETPKTASFLPSVSISLPPDILSETVQISYFLVGPFGGYGGYAAQRTGVHSYEIPTMVDGKAATEIRMIVHASGCEIQQFVLPLAEHSRVSQEFPCQRVKTVELSGKIVPSALVRDNHAEMVITYMAYWAHGFYGISDGFVTEFHLATVSPDADGMFQVDLPYFSADVEASSSQQRASFWLVLRDSKTWNPIASNLEPEKQELRLKEHGLRIRSHYPDDLIFKAESFVQLSTIKGKVFRSDSGEAISNSYILLTGEKDEATHFDTRTDEKGEYLFGGIPAGNYTVSVYAWFPKRSEVPCQNPLEQKTADGGDITVEWQWKSQAFMEIVTLKRFSIELDRENVQDFDLVGR